MAIRKPIPTLRIPDFDRVTDDSGMLTPVWRDYFRLIKSTLDPLGVEKSFSLENNQITVANITGLKFSSDTTSQVIVDYVIQRVTTGTNPVEKLESGSFHLIYRPTLNSWVKFVPYSPGPDSSGVTLTVTSDGQVQYVSSLVDGTASISKIIYRARTLAGKNTQYSTV